MENEERMRAQVNLDKELRYFKMAAKKTSNYPNWLRRVRQALGVRATEIADKLEVNTSVIFRLERSEDKKSISLKALERVASAMDCRVVYALVPRRGESLMELAERERWVRRLK